MGFFERETWWQQRKIKIVFPMLLMAAKKLLSNLTNNFILSWSVLCIRNYILTTQDWKYGKEFGWKCRWRQRSRLLLQKKKKKTVHVSIIDVQIFVTFATFVARVKLSGRWWWRWLLIFESIFTFKKKKKTNELLHWRSLMKTLCNWYLCINISL